uniref:TSA: Wollemia nobilis Ref_Wollemi_Transcript_9860_1464 transcribed RNA sequence n=1 Tax=Wollemia nobilis TaxID=56998 RepID=A0A0C9S909_9CONI
MRMSCNGCRVLRKGCSDSCALRPCLQWIRSAEAQANATVFLAKFYGRSGLMKLLTSGPEHLRHVIFKSLLYEACGRIVNPVHGSMGLQCSGNWHICHAAVESVLRGQPVQPLEIGGAHDSSDLPDIKQFQFIDSTVTEKLLKVKNGGRFKRVSNKKSRAENKRETDVTTKEEDVTVSGSASQVCNLRWRRCYPQELQAMNDAEPQGNLLWTESSSDSDELRSDGSRLQIAEEVCRDNENIKAEDDAGAMEIHKEKEAMESGEDMENFHSGDDGDENDVELELRLGSPPLSETVQPQPRHFMPSYSHWRGASGCKDHFPFSVTSLSLGLS